MTVKDLAVKLAQEEVRVRALIAMFEIPPRGLGPKPKNGATPKTYRLSDLQNALQAIQDYKQKLES
jgi:hypothetical protein